MTDADQVLYICPTPKHLGEYVRKVDGTTRQLTLEWRAAGYANLAVGDDEKRTALKRVSVFIEHPIELVNLYL